MATISAVIFNRNNKDHLVRCIKSAAFADELVVIDGQSDDGSVATAKTLTDQVIVADIKAEFVEQIRGWGAAQAHGDWLLILDADEEVPPALPDALRNLVKGDATAYRLPRKNLIFGTWVHHTGWWPDYQIRLVKKGSTEWPTRIHLPPIVKGTIEDLEAREELALIHHNYASVAEYVERLNRYTSIEATQTPAAAGNQPLWRTFADEFMWRYFKESGYKDGQVGSFLAVSQSYYQVVAAMKRRELTGKWDATPDFPEAEWERLYRDGRYWLETVKGREARNPLSRLLSRVRRKWGK